MSICSNSMRPDAAREEAIKLFISAIQVAPETVPKGLSGEKFAEFLITGAANIIKYVEPLATQKTD